MGEKRNGSQEVEKR